MDGDKVPSGDEAIEASGQEVEESPKQQDSVSYETHRRLLAEKKKRDEDLRAAREQLQALQSEAEKRQTEELKQKEDFKRLYEMTKDELEKTRGELSTTSEKITRAKKFDSFFTKLGVDIPQKFWQHVPLDSLIVDETGKIEELSLEAAINDFRTEYPEIIEMYSKKGKSSLPQQAAMGLGSPMSSADKSAHELSEMLSKLL